MMTVLLVIHLMVTLVMIGLILLQRSEGGGLGIGGGGGGLGSFATPRATANVLTRATMVCFALFVILSLIMAIMAGQRGGSTLIDRLAEPVATTAAEPSTAPSETSGTAVTPQVPLAK